MKFLDDHLHIFSSNVVDLSSYSILKDKLKDINEKNPDDLKKLYLEILKAGVFGEKGGAGLGLFKWLDALQIQFNIIFHLLMINLNYSNIRLIFPFIKESVF